MNQVQLIAAYVEKFKYSKGRFVGEAPVEKRGKSHFRVRIETHLGKQEARVRFHNTDIVVFYEDGSVRFNAGGWATARTTREAIWDAGKLLSQAFYARHKIDTGDFEFPPHWLTKYFQFSTYNKSGWSTTVVGGKYVYYHGMRFDKFGNLMGNAMPFHRRVRHVEAKKEWLAKLKAAGFYDLFPMLWLSASPDMNMQEVYRVQMEDALCQQADAHLWPTYAVYAFRQQKGHSYAAASDILKQPADVLMKLMVKQVLSKPKFYRYEELANVAT